MGSKMLPTIWGTYMKLVTKYQISAINSCWEKCDEKCAYMFNVYRNQLSRQTGSRNLTGPKTLPTIWHTYMKLVTKYILYQNPVINSCWEKCDESTPYRGKRFPTHQIPVCWFCWFLYIFNIHLYMHIFRRIFLSNYWWQESDTECIWSPASYMYAILWEAFLDPSDSYFLFADLVGVINSWWEKCDEKCAYTNVC
jgi:hypothetical protein